MLASQQLGQTNLVSAYRLLARCCCLMLNSDWFKAVGLESLRVRLGKWL